MDGTLTRTNELIFNSFNHVAEKYLHKRLSPGEIIALFGPPEEQAIERMIGPKHIETAMEEYFSFYRREHSSTAALYPGMTDVLDFLKSKNVKIGLFTGKGRRAAEITLEQFGISSYFDVTMTGDDVDEYKPSGDGIKKILAALALSPADVLMVGDAVADHIASREAGVDVASVVWDSYAKDEVTALPSEYLFHDIRQLLQWLHEIYSPEPLTTVGAAS